MKRFVILLVVLILTAGLGLAAYLTISPYHVRLRADIMDPAKREAAARTALAFEKVHVGAIEGRAADEYALARHFTTGDLGFKDADQAQHWYQRAADHGYPRAQLKIAACYFTGENVPKDEAVAADWTQKAFQGGVQPARDLMGAMLAGGIGGPQDLTAGMDIIKGAHNSKVLLIGNDTDQKLKAIYALPREQREPELKKLADAVKAQIRAEFPGILSEAVDQAVIDPDKITASN